MQSADSIRAAEEKQVLDVYVYYEHFKDATGKIILTELRLSSQGDGSLWVNVGDSMENLRLKLCVPILKQPDSSLRTFDNTTKVWSYTGNAGVAVLSALKSVCASLGGITEVEAEDLAEQCRSGRIRFDARKKAQKAEDFFYNHGTVQSTPELTKEQITAKLTEMLGTVIDKSSYRKAALRFHPDRNNGDGSKMSELNMLWQMYNA
jgi:hypothetical protein